MIDQYNVIKKEDIYPKIDNTYYEKTNDSFSFNNTIVKEIEIIKNSKKTTPLATPYTVYLKNGTNLVTFFRNNIDSSFLNN